MISNPELITGPTGNTGLTGAAGVWELLKFSFYFA